MLTQRSFDSKPLTAAAAAAAAAMDCQPLLCALNECECLFDFVVGEDKNYYIFTSTATNLNTSHKHTYIYIYIYWPTVTKSLTSI